MITDYVKARVYDIIMDHLEVACNDSRKREQLRAMTALKKIKKWTEDEYVKSGITGCN